MAATPVEGDKSPNVFVVAGFFGCCLLAFLNQRATEPRSIIGMNHRQIVDLGLYPVAAPSPSFRSFSVVDS